MLAASLALAAAGLAAATTASAQAAAPAAHTANGHGVDYTRACPAASRSGTAACMVLVRTDVTQLTQRAMLRAEHTAGPAAAPTGVGYGPASLQSAYKLPSSTAGTGQTVAVVDAFDDPNAAANLANYRSSWGLPACGAGCFKKVGQTGTAALPRANRASGWATEESLDIDMVSAICPLCHIILVETNSASLADLGAGVNAAVKLGAKFVSNSYGGSESASEASQDTSFFKHAGVAVTASAGDNGFKVSYPAASQYVVAVGGTALNTSASARGWTESVWSTSRTVGTGSGCSAREAKPAWQTDTGCTRRSVGDVAAVADPNTGVAVYDTYDQKGWLEVGGTSASSPIIASVYALAGAPGAATFPASDIYQHTGSLFDVTAGSTATCTPAYLCTAETGYDGPTGWGTPDGTAAFTG